MDLLTSAPSSVTEAFSTARQKDCPNLDGNSTRMRVQPRETRDRAGNRGNFVSLIVTAALTISLVVLCVGAQHRIPRPDEGHFSSAAYNLARLGYMGTTTIDPDATGLLRIHKETYFVMPLYLLAQAGWLKLFPATIFSIRLLNVLLLIPVLACIYRIVHILTASKVTAALAVALLPLDYAFMFAAVSARPEILCLLFAMVAIAGYLTLRTSSFQRALLWAAGFLTLSGLTHPNAIIHAVVLAALILYYDRSRIDLKGVVASMLLSGLVILPWALYAWKDFPAFQAQMSANALNNHRFAASLNPIRLFAEELGRYANAYGLTSERTLPKLKALLLVPYIATLAAALLWPSFRSVKGVRVLLAGWMLCFAIQCVFNQKLSVYLVHILPFYAALVALLCVFLWQNHRTPAMGLVALLIAATGVHAGGMFLTSFDESDALQLQTAKFIAEKMKAAQMINGSVILLYDMNYDSRLMEDHALGITSGKHPDVIVIDDNYRESFAFMAKSRPALFAQVQSRLGHYALAKQFGTYQVYVDPKLWPSDDIKAVD